MAFNFEDELGGMDDASLMDILGFAPTGSPAQKSLPPVQPAAPSGGFLNATPAPSPFISASAPSPSVVGAPMAAPAPSPFVSPFSARLEPDQPQPMLYGWEARKEEPPQSVLDQLRALQSQQTSPQIPSSAGVTFVPEGSEPPTIAVGRTEQPPSFDELMGYVMSGQPMMKAVSALAPISSSVPAYAPAPSPVYTQAPAASPAPTPFAAPSPMNLFGMDVTQDQLADLGVSAPAAPAPSPVQAPAPSTVAQAPAPTGHWESMGGGEGGGQSVWVEDKPKPIDQTLQYYQPFSGQISSALTKYMPKSGSDLYGSWHFDTPESRQVVTTTHPETGETSSGTVGMLDAAPRYQTDENGNPIGLNPDYGLKDTTGLVHGAQAVPIDKTHIKYTYSFFDPKTGKPVGNPVTQVVEQKQSWSDKLTDIGMALASAAITGGTLGGQLFNVAKAAGTGNTLGALTGALGIAGGAGDVLGADVAGAAKTAKDVIGAGTALQSGDPLRILGAAANVTGSEDLANVAKAANTAAVLGKAARGDVGAALNLLNMVGPTAFSQLTGGPGAMTAGEADERKGVSEVADLLSKSVTGQGSLEDLEQMYAAEGDRAGTTAAIDALTKGADTAASVSGEDLVAGASDQTIQDLLDAGLTGAGTTQTAEDLARELGLDTGTEGTSTGAKGTTTAFSEGDYEGVGNLGQDFVVTETGDIKDTAGNYGNFDPATGEWTPYKEQLDVSDDLQTVDVTGKKLDNLEDYGLTDQEKEDRDAVKAIIDDFGYTAGGGDTRGGTGGGTGGTGGKGGGTGGTKTTTTTTPTAAKSGLDPMALLALSSMFGQQPQTGQVRENAARIAAKSPFGTLPYSDILDAYNDIYGA